MMKMNTGMRRMDSLMVASNIKKMSRLELLYTCVANLCKLMKRLEDPALIISACGSRYDEYSEYQLLIRAINQQTKSDPDGNLVLKSAHDGTGSNVLQNPADPDATYRKKSGKEHGGYIANVVEVADNNHNSITVNYQYEKNTYSDSQFLKTDEFKKLARFRNGIETVPAALRNRHHIDKIPVRGFLKTKLFFGFKIAGMNARKLIRYLTSQVSVAVYPESI